MATGQASGITVVDVDGDKGGYDTLAQLETDNGTLPVTQRVKTASGEHVYLKFPGQHVKNTSGKLGPGLDIRCCGGYVVTVGAVHCTGAVYAWVDGLRPDEVPLAEMPKWLLELLVDKPAPRRDIDIHGPSHRETGNRYAAAAFDAELSILASTPEGQRNVQLNRSAFSLGQLVAAGHIARSEVEDSLLNTALNIGLGDTGARKTIQSGIEGGMREPREIPESMVRGNSHIVHHDTTTSADADSATPSWPAPLSDVALYGPTGRLIRAIEPYTEADTAALLAHILSGAGALLGPNIHAVAGDAEHPSRLNCVVVGETSKGRKGSSARPTERGLKLADDDFAARITEGLSSGEGLIWAVRDPVERYERTGRGGDKTTELVETDPGISDKRLWVLESEFASVLRVAQRDGNTLTTVVRRAWDSGDLRTLTKNNPAVATGSHICITGHVTKDELLRYLDRSELASGFANRFLWFAARRGRLLPHGDRVPDAPLQEFAQTLRTAREWAATSKRRIGWDDEAAAVWSDVYGELSAGRPGLFGAATSRAEAQVLRLAVFYATLDLASAIRADHLLAALAVWEYAAASARWIFGDATGDPIADTILAALRRQQELTRLDIFEVFGRNVNKSRIERALSLLIVGGLARRGKRETGGRPAEVWHAA